jgi:hypothetical protein
MNNNTNNTGLTDTLYYEGKDYKLKPYKSVSSLLYWVLVDNEREIFNIFEEDSRIAKASKFIFITSTQDGYVIYIFAEVNIYPRWEYFIKFGTIKINGSEVLIKELYRHDISDFYKEYYFYKYKEIEPGINTFMAYNANLKHFCMIRTVYDHKHIMQECPILLWKIGNPSDSLIIDNGLIHRMADLQLINSQQEFDLIEDYLQIIGEDQIRLGITVKSENGDWKNYSLVYDPIIKVITAVEQLTV